MGQIQVMSEALANQIAAGEVVERPASCVKELVENSLDAGAKSIVVQLEEGGIRRIRVQDDGHGMDETDLKLAFARHATSKVKSSRDLFRIGTLGFRGEALASIAAVSRVTLQARTETSEQGHSIRVEGSSTQGSVDPVGMPVGTIIDVADLFFNTPARLKYLRTVQTEQARCVEVVQKAALSRPDVRMRVEVDGHVLFQTTGAGNPQNVLATLYGVGEAGQFLKVQGETPDYRISGYIGRPTQARSNRQHANLFINHRPIRNIAIHQAIAAGYGQRLMVNKQPIYAIYIDLDPGLVDVNIHPHKSEVRFSEERDLTLLMTKLVRQALDDAFLVPTAKFGSTTGYGSGTGDGAGSGSGGSLGSGGRPTRPVQSALDGIIPKSPWRQEQGGQRSYGDGQRPGYGQQNGSAQRPSDAGVAGYRPVEQGQGAEPGPAHGGTEQHQTDGRTAGHGVAEQTQHNGQRPYGGHTGNHQGQRDAKGQQPKYPAGSRPLSPEVLETVYGKAGEAAAAATTEAHLASNADMSGVGTGSNATGIDETGPNGSSIGETGTNASGPNGTGIGGASIGATGTHALGTNASSADTGARPDDGMVRESDNSADNASDRTPTRESWRLRPIGQTLGMYILADDGEDLYIIDQHAAHERVLYERFTKQMEATTSHSIELLTPMTFHLSPGDASVLSQHIELLAEMGLSFEPFGGYSFLLRSIPTVWDGLDPAQMAQDLVSSIAEDARAANVKEALRERIILRACKAAIKANHRLSDLEMNALIEAFSDLDDPFHCPHGRPVFLRLTSRDLEKEFRRIV